MNSDFITSISTLIDLISRLPKALYSKAFNCQLKLNTEIVILTAIFVENCQTKAIDLSILCDKLSLKRLISRSQIVNFCANL